MDGQGPSQGYGQHEPRTPQAEEYRGSQQQEGEEYPEGDEYDAEQGLEGAEGERGIIGDTYRKFRGKPPKKPAEDPGLGSFIFGKLQGAVQDISSEIGKRIDGRSQQSRTSAGGQSHGGAYTSNTHRYGSFAAQRTGNDAKWFVDGCGYFWAVSQALEEATQSIWILDCEYFEFLHMCIISFEFGLVSTIASFSVTLIRYNSVRLQGVSALKHARDFVSSISYPERLTFLSTLKSSADLQNTVEHPLGKLGYTEQIIRKPFEHAILLSTHCNNLRD